MNYEFLPQNIDHLKKLFLDASAYIIPSGSFLCNRNLEFEPFSGHGSSAPNYIDIEGGSISNTIVYSDATYEDSKEVFSVSNDIKPKVITEQEIDSFSNILIRLAEVISQDAPKFILCPLRGSYKPLMHLLPMGVVKDICWLNYSGGSSGQFDNRISDELKVIFENYYSTPFNIYIVDTMIGGYGINHLIKLIKNIHNQYKKDAWHLKILSICDNRINKIYCDNIYRQVEYNFIVNINYFETKSLFFEDCDATIGLRVEDSDGVRYIKRTSVKGNLLLKKEKTIILIESEDLCKSVDNIIANKISDKINDASNLKFQKLLVRDFLNR